MPDRQIRFPEQAWQQIEALPQATALELVDRTGATSVHAGGMSGPFRYHATVIP